MKRLVGFILILYTVAGLYSSSGSNVSNSANSGISPEDVDTSAENQYIRISPYNLEIMSPSSGVQYYRDGIIFLSKSKSAGRMLPGHVSFGTTNTMYAVLNDTLLENPQLFCPTSEFIYPTEAYTFSSDYNTMYFTRISETDGLPKIYQAICSKGSGNQGSWSVEKNPVSFCTGKSTYTHPSLSADGKLLIFSSDRAGSVGGMDLFVSQNIKGSWSDPVSLGDAVNSRSNELYPYLDSQNNLFFSSDGIPGYGGYDIFVCKFKVDTWEHPVNLSTPVNTRFDDVAFTMNRRDGRSAFYTVKQKSVITPAKLYMVSMDDFNGPEKAANLSQIFTNPRISRMVILAIDPPVEASDRRAETTRLRSSESRGDKENYIYRVQFLTSFNPRTRSLVNINGKDYPVFEYLYSGAYRLCLGEFSTPTPALELQNLLRKDEYPNAFVVAFRNNVPSFDPELLKELPGSVTVTAAAEKKVEPEKHSNVTETKPETSKESKPVSATSAPAPSKTTPTTAKTTSTVTAKTTSSTVAKPASSAVTSIPKTASAGTEAKKDVVVYRIQILASMTRKGSYKITFNSKSYNTFEYQHGGAYRTCIGEFSTLAPAVEFQNALRKSGYTQAFVVAFRNNVRTTDPALFK